MKQSLQLKMGQQLTMTPQLQQAIRLLQLSSLDLQQEIQEALENNPLLELEAAEESFGDNSGEHSDSSADSNDSHTTSASASSSDDTGDGQLNNGSDDSQLESSDAMAKDQLPDDLPTDSTWDDTYSAGSSSASSGGGGFGDDDEMSYQGETSESLQDYLLWQMRLSHFSEEDELIATAIIEAIDEAGYLTVPLEDILDSVSATIDTQAEDIGMEEICMVLKRVQQFDPLGVAARSVAECLDLQLKALPADTPWVSQARLTVSEHMNLLASRDYRTLARKLKIQEGQLREVLRLIHGLHPRPGDTVIQQSAEYVIPDVTVVKKNGRWIVELNPESVPKLRVNEEYAAMSRHAKNPEDGQYIRHHTQEARWFIKSLESRNETLLKVSNCIVHRQQAFFEYGEEAMKPMVLNDVAEAVDMHESTISRVTTQKFMHTPRGVFELKYFFSSHVSTENGGECSSTAIRAFIKKLVSAENAKKPLSDSKIAELMAAQGIQVARRTIAKYRESLNIPASSQRKSLL